ncbi:DUF2179 domain-containing protein [Patescibacteria group bacterium]
MNSSLISAILPSILIFFGRILDVSLTTIRTNLVTKGYKTIAPFVGLAEILVWLYTAGYALKNLDNPLNVIAYALGFSLGNYVGMRIEESLSMGTVAVRIVTKRNPTKLIKTFRKEGLAFTHTYGEGNSGKIAIIYCTIKRKNYKKWLNIVKKFNPGSFYTIEEIRYVNSDVFSIDKPHLNKSKRK